jgi:tyrocidine synthetase-3
LAPLLRVGLIKIDEEKQVLAVDMHHIICDPISHEVLIHEFKVLSQGKELAQPGLQYRDYAQWQNREEQKEKIKQQEAYWIRLFSDEIPILYLPTDFPRPQVREFQGAAIEFILGEKQTQILKNTANENDVTLYMIILAVFNVLLAKLSGQEDIIIGTPVSTRQHPGLENMIGMFVNTLAIRNYPAGQKTVKEFLQEIKTQTLDAYKNGEYPFEELVQKLVLKRDTGRNAIFDVMFNFLDRDESGEDMTGLAAQEIFQPGEGTSKFDLTLSVLDMGSSMLCTCEYSTRLFKAGTIERFIAYFKLIVSGVLCNKELKIGDIEIISGEEKREILTRFNHFEAGYIRDRTLPQLFLEQVEKTPDQIALTGQIPNSKSQIPNTSNDMHLSYGELNEKSRQLAYYLLQRGVKPGGLVGILVEPSIGMIVGILAILKTGSGYVPLNPKAPWTRNRYMLEECNMGILLTTAKFQVKVKAEVEGRNIEIIDIFAGLSSRGSALTPACQVSAANLAYVIFTSGSTGMPKGVPITHANVSPLLHWGYRHLGIGKADRTLRNLSYFFDWSVMEIFITLTTGAALYIVPEDLILQPEQCVDFLETNAVTILHITPTQYSYIVNTGRKTATLRYLFIGAEKLTYDLVQRSFSAVSLQCRVFNMYGPTEAAIISTVLEIHREDYKRYERLSSVPIGKPTGNIELLILDSYLKMCPVNIGGELYIAGDGLSRGYLNNPELTTEKFCTHLDRSYMFDKTYSSEKFYKTGDLARWLEDGNIEFLGRIDQQLKIRGYRIEPGEIESRLLTHAKIKQAVIIDKTDRWGEKYLCAYIITQPPGTTLPIPAAELREFLSGQLPVYMIPSYFVPLHEIPLNPSGKINRNALPTPGIKPGEAGTYTAPESEIEKKLAAIWAEILGSETGKISIHDNFFQLGGHSLSAARLTSKILARFKVDIPLMQVFKTPTISALAGYVQKAGETRYSTIEPVEIREYYKLTPVQKRQYILQQLDPAGTAYNVPAALTLTKEVDKERLEEIFKTLIARHEILRTSFRIIDEEPLQKIHDKVKFEIECYESGNRQKAISNREELMPKPYSLMPEHIQKNFVRPFDLSRAPLLRVGLIKIAGEKQLLAVDMHHIICDPVSHKVLAEEFAALLQGKELPGLRLQYKDYSQWQSSREQKEKMKQQEAYWLGLYANVTPGPDLPTDFPRPQTRSYKGASINFPVEDKINRQLRNMAIENQATTYMLILAIFNILLAKLSVREDIIIGTPVSIRHHPDLERMIGMFVNTLAIPNNPAGHKTVTQFLQEVKTQTLEAQGNRDYPFEELVEKIPVKRDISRNSLFDVMFNFLTPSAIPVEEPGIDTQELNQHKKGTAKFDMNLRALDIDNKLLFNLEYCTALFKPGTINRIIEYFKNITAAVLENPGKKIKEIELISPREKSEILSQFNRELSVPGTGVFQQELFKSLHSNKDRIAVEYGANRVTYAQLEKRSRLISRKLLSHGIPGGSLIGIYLEDRLEIITAMMGILKARCIFVPLDTTLPGKRIRRMIRQTRPRLIFIDKTHREQLTRPTGETLEETDFAVVDASFYRECETLAPVKESRDNKEDDKIYIYFTSGSTGAPEAIVGKNNSLTHFIRWEIKTFGLAPGSRVSQLSAVGFDAFLRNVFTPLCGGGVVCIPADKETVKHGTRLIDWINRRQIQWIHCVPSMFRLLNPDILTPRHFKALKYVFLSGEVILPYELKKWYDIFDRRIQLVNYYGPTETTMIKLYYPINKKDIQGQKIPVGKPMPGAGVIIVDENMVPCARGTAGEIFIRTPYTTFGYYNNPALTQKKFIPNPFANNPPDPVYRTGDIGKLLENGNIEFLGRKDRLVKIRGVRIELGEIESQLLRHPDIKEAAAAVKKGTTGAGEILLCAYIVSQRNVSTPELREHLRQELPGYMIPSYFVPMERMPLTPNGKIDIQALPEPGTGSTASRYTPPRNQIEKTLLAIWSEVLALNRESTGIDDDFFELGGNSLNATVITAKIHKLLKVKIPLAQIFKTSSPRALAQYIENAEKDKYISLEPVEKKEYYILSSSQRRLYVLQQMEFAGTAYNMPRVFQLEAAELDIVKLEKAFKQLIYNHESLRTSFAIIDGEPVQKVNNEVEFEIECFNLGNRQKAIGIRRQEAIGNREELMPNACRPMPGHSIKNFIRPFDLSQAPLLRAGLFPAPGTRYPASSILMIDMHHIIADGISTAILVKEFMSFYRGENTAGPQNRITYKDFAGWQNSPRAKEILQQQEAYWLNQFKEKAPVLNLPAEITRPVIQRYEGNILNFKIEKEAAQALKTYARQQGATLFMVLLTAYNILLSRLSGQEDIVVGTPVAGRIHSDLQDIMGMFVNTLALRSFPAGGKTVKEFLAQVKNQTLAAFTNQAYPFENLVEKAAPARDTSRNPFFDTMFILQNFETPHLEIPGIHLKPYPYEPGISRFDLTLEITAHQDFLWCIFEYSNALFKIGTIKRFITYFKKIIFAVIEKPGIRISDIEIIPAEEKRQLLYDFNATKAGYPPVKTIGCWNREQAEKTPAHIAAVFEEQHISYALLNTRADSLAKIIRAKGVKPGIIVGLMVNRSLEMLLGILAILKAGAAYLPIDPQYPGERIKYMIKDSSTTVLVTTPGARAKIKAELEGGYIEVIDISGPSSSPALTLTSTSTCRVSSADLAYVIYTSGSTGKPKGVTVSHKNVINFIQGITAVIRFLPGKTILAVTTLCFDIFVLETLLPLVKGLKVLIATENQQKDPRLLADKIVENNVNMLQLTPSRLQLIIESDHTLNCLRKVEVIMVGGESLPVNLFQRLKEGYKGKIYNMYGPTETTVWSTIKDLSAAAGITVGTPIANTRIYIIDRCLKLQPVGVAGELCIGGASLARGYLNDPELTAGKFKPQILHRRYTDKL